MLYKDCHIEYRESRRPLHGGGVRRQITALKKPRSNILLALLHAAKQGYASNLDRRAVEFSPTLNHCTEFRNLVATNHNKPLRLCDVTLGEHVLRISA